MLFDQWFLNPSLTPPYAGPLPDTAHHRGQAATLTDRGGQGGGGAHGRVPAAAHVALMLCVAARGDCGRCHLLLPAAA